MTAWSVVVMFRTLYSKLALAMLFLVALSGLFYLGVTVSTTRLYQQELNQDLNRSLAAHIVKEYDLTAGGELNRAALKSLFGSLMHVNPAIEVYLTDLEGHILAFTAAPGKVKREQISVAPVEAFLAARDSRPILGDDPRSDRGSKVFSAARLVEGGTPVGYLYVVLGGEDYDSAVEMFEGSYILRLATGLAFVGLLVVALVGLTSFNWLTRRLRRLMSAVEAFRASGFRDSVSLDPWNRGARGDEIDALGLSFEQNSARIVEQMAALRDADSRRRELVANISHDLRTPLAAMQGYLETILIKHNSMAPGEQVKCLELAHKHGQQMSELVGELFELSVLDAPDPPRCFEAFPLGELAHDVAQKFTPASADKGIEFDIDIVSDPHFVRGDIGMIERVLDNLLENAIKYTPSGGRVRLTVAEADSSVSVQVSDTGPGIAADELPRVFERFYRVEKSRGAGAPGAGLGLAIAQRIVELHDSELTVHSAQDVGTTFGFVLPMTSTSSQ